MSCPDHPQWYHDREDCPFCVAIEIRAEQQRRQSPPRVHVSQLRGEPPPAQQTSAAWQDVITDMVSRAGEYAQFPNVPCQTDPAWHRDEIGGWVARIQQARAADAQQNAALRAENEQLRDVLVRELMAKERAETAEAALADRRDKPVE